MIFDGHSDLLYDVTRRRLAGETCVLERRHRQKLRKGRIGGLGRLAADGGNDGLLSGGAGGQSVAGSCADGGGSP